MCLVKSKAWEFCNVQKILLNDVTTFRKGDFHTSPSPAMTFGKEIFVVEFTFFYCVFCSYSICCDHFYWSFVEASLNIDFFNWLLPKVIVSYHFAGSYVTCFIILHSFLHHVLLIVEYHFTVLNQVQSSKNVSNTPFGKKKKKKLNRIYFISSVYDLYDIVCSRRTRFILILVQVGNVLKGEMELLYLSFVVGFSVQCHWLNILIAFFRLWYCLKYTRENTNAVKPIPSECGLY